MMYAPNIDTQQSSLSYESKEIQTIVFMVNLPDLPSSSCVLSSSTESNFGSSFAGPEDSNDSTISSTNDYGFYDFRDFIISHNSNLEIININHSILSQIKNKISSILNKIAELHKGWDGRGAVPVDPQSIENVKAIAEHQWNWNFKLWQIAPGVNGDIFINYKGKNKLAGFVIGSTTFSYFIEDETLQGDRNVPFDGLRVSNLMNAIANA